MAVFSPLLDVLADVPDPRRAQGQLYKLAHVLLFASSSPTQAARLLCGSQHECWVGP